MDKLADNVKRLGLAAGVSNAEAVLISDIARVDHKAAENIANAPTGQSMVETARESGRVARPLEKQRFCVARES